MFEVIFLNIILDELTAEEYLYMHKLVGFYLYPLEDIVSALGKDIVNVKVFFDNQLIGIGRVVGDGRIVFFLKDIIVHPKYRNKGVGTIVVNTLLERIQSICCDHSYVGLMSTVGTEGFYEKFGFITRPNNHFGSGMVMYVEK